MKLVALLSCLLLLVAPGCGNDQATEVPIATMDGPPRWRLVREDKPADGTALTLHARTPTRVRFRVEQTGRDPEHTPWRTLAAGQVVRVAWSHVLEPREQIEESPTPSDREAGRSVPHAVTFHYHYADRAVHFARLLAFARDGLGHVAVEEALPPGKYEDLPLPGRIELTTALVSDYREGRATIRRRGLGAVVVRPEAASQGDRLDTFRLQLELEPADAPSR